MSTKLAGPWYRRSGPMQEMPRGVLDVDGVRWRVNTDGAHLVGVVTNEAPVWIGHYDVGEKVRAWLSAPMRDVVEVAVPKVRDFLRGTAPDDDDLQWFCWIVGLPVNASIARRALKVAGAHGSQVIQIGIIGTWRNLTCKEEEAAGVLAIRHPEWQVVIAPVDVRTTYENPDSWPRFSIESNTNVEPSGNPDTDKVG